MQYPTPRTPYRYSTRSFFPPFTYNLLGPAAGPLAVVGRNLVVADYSAVDLRLRLRRNVGIGCLVCC